MLTERGLAPAIVALAARAPVPVEIVDLPEERLPAAAETTAYFTVSEALTSVAKYANATHARSGSRARPTCSSSRSSTTAWAARAPASARPQRAGRPLGACDGTLSVTSPPGRGTLVRAVLPLRKVPAPAERG